MNESVKNQGANILRQKAEKLLSSKTVNSNSLLTESDSLKLIHELQVHQIELELQNEELVLAKEQAEQATDKYTELYDFAPIGYFTISKTGKIIELNFEASKMLGKERSYFLYSHFGLFVSDSFKTVFNNFLNNVFSSFITETCEITLVTKNNTFLNVYLTGVAKENDEKCFITATDITQHKEDQEALRKSEERTRLLVENSGNMVTIHDFNGKYIYYSGPQKYGIKPSDVIGKTPFDFFDENTAQQIVEQIRVTASTGKSGRIDIYVNWLGKMTWFEEYIYPIIKDNTIVSVGKICVDISERKNKESELLVAKEQAEESDRLKTAFLQNMSHEIRTPMNAIKGFSEILAKKKVPDAKQKEFATIINQRSDDLLEIINDILDIAKIESGQLPVYLEECNIDVLFAELTFQFIEYQKRYNKQHISFRLLGNCKPSNSVVVTDKGKLKQILVNLLTNAFKFTESGIIESACKIENNKLVFYVSDTGIGIPEDKHKLIFERFAQISQGNNRAMGGTGLGLSIVKGLVNLLGGEIALISEPGKGTTFTISIPFSEQNNLVTKELVYPKANFSQFKNKTVLIVEDDIYNAEYLKVILEDAGLKTLLATRGKEAIQVATYQNVDLVLMDIKLPDTDGYEAMRQIRKQKPNLKIIAQTAFAAYSDKQNALNAGFNDYTSKPIKEEQLLLLISTHLAHL